MTKAEVLAAAAKGEGCLGKCADDEPVFILCARDQLSVHAMVAWVNAAVKEGVNESKITGALSDWWSMARWRQAHGGGKLPD